MARNKSHLGTSKFTHIDDSTAPIHTTDPNAHFAHQYGDEHPPRNPQAEIILGPPAFGSPDPRTLGHRMNPREDRPASAPELDPDFHEVQGTDHVTNYTDDEVQTMSKDDLLTLARENNIPVKSGASRDEILSALGYDDDDSDDEVVESA